MSADEDAGYSLRKRQDKKQSESEQKKEKKEKLTPKQYYEASRYKLINDEKRYAQYKSLDAQKKREYRMKLSGERLSRSNEKAKQRMRAYRQRQKEKGLAPKPKTRHMMTKHRVYWREKKRESRQRMTAEAKEKERKKRREHYRASKRKLFDGPQTPKEDRLYLSKRADRFATKLKKVVESSTPKKKNALMKKGLIMPISEKMKIETDSKIVARLRVALKELRKHKAGRHLTRKLTSTIVGRYAVETNLRKALDIKWEYWRRISDIEEDDSARRHDSLPDETVHEVQTFYRTESVILPIRRTVSKKTFTQKHVLTDTIQQVHKRFLKERPKQKVSLSHFRKMRPANVLTVKQQKFYTCLCEYCLNAQFMIDALNTAFKATKVEKKIESKYDAVNMTLCGEDGDQALLKCYERKCSQCGADKLRDFLQPLVEKGSRCTWKTWKLADVGTPNVPVRRQILVEEEGTMAHLVDDFVSAIDFLANHLFTAKWQYRQFNDLTRSVPENVVLTLADFAENYRCVHQDEISSAFYCYKQVTLFPVIAYYLCPECKEATVQESVVFISPDLKHDAFAVKTFKKTMSEHLRKSVNFKKEVQFTDGCSSQFKSKLPFLHTSETETHSVEQAFFGSRHGKSPCDALGGIVKQQAETYVKSRKGTIQSAEELFNFCQKNLTKGDCEKKCEHKKRVFFLKDGVERDTSVQDLQTLKGTQKVHSVRGVEPGLVKSRNLSCFCEACLKDEGGKCPNDRYVKEWSMHSLAKSRKKNMKETDSTLKEDKSPVRLRNVTGRKKGRRSVVKQKTKGKEKTPSKIRQKKEKIIVKLPKVKRDKTLRLRNRTSRKSGVQPVLKRKTKTTAPLKVSTVKQDNKTVRLQNITSRTKGVKPVQKLKTKTTAPSKSRQEKEDLDISHCSTMRQLKAASEERKFQDLPDYTAKSFNSTKQKIDQTSIPLVPDDIPHMHDTLLPAVITADGNCLPRSASLIAYGTQAFFKEMRERIVVELVQNQDVYLNEEYMKKGMNPSGNKNVTKTIAAYSSIYRGGPLNEKNIKMLYEEEVLSVCKDGAYMGLWQIASIANIISRPVVSVCPCYGMHNVRKDMHRVFYPHREQFCNRDPVFIMWTNTKGCSIPAETFSVNHFVVLMPEEPLQQMGLSGPWEPIKSTTDSPVAEIQHEEEMDHDLPPESMTSSSDLPHKVASMTSEEPLQQMGLSGPKETIKGTTDSPVAEIQRELQMDHDLPPETMTTCSDLPHKVASMTSEEQLQQMGLSGPEEAIKGTTDSPVAEIQHELEMDHDLPPESMTTSSDLPHKFASMTSEEPLQQMGLSGPGEPIKGTTNSPVAETQHEEEMDHDLPPESMTTSSDLPHKVASMTSEEPLQQMGLFGPEEPIKGTTDSPVAEIQRELQMDHDLPPETMTTCSDLPHKVASMTSEEQLQQMGLSGPEEAIKGTTDSPVAEIQRELEMDHYLPPESMTTSSDLPHKFASMTSEEPLQQMGLSGPEEAIKGTTDSPVAETHRGQKMDHVLLTESLSSDNHDSSMASQYPVGTNLSVRNGSDTLNAIVVQSPPDSTEHNIHGLWVRFYKKARGHHWTLEEKAFFVCWGEIIKTCEEPSITMCGSRSYYNF